MHLGELGKDRKTPEPITFSWFGATIRTGTSGGLELIEFMEAAGAVDYNTKDPSALFEASRIVTKFLRDQIHPDDWSTFWTLAKQHHQQVEDLMAISKAIIEAQSAFPTGPLPVSSNGQPPTDGKSTVASLHPSVHVQAMEQLRGRPDLQTAVLHSMRDSSVQRPTES